MHEPKRWVDVAGAAACSALAAWLVLRPFNDVDYYWHLAVGRYIAQHHALPTQNLWSFTAPDHPFAATAWLFDLLLHGLWSLGGTPLVHAAMAVLAAATLALTYLTSRRMGAHPRWALALTATAALVSAFRFVPRPHMASYLFLSATAYGLVLAWQGRRWALWAIPPMIALWSNFHAGAVFGTGAVLGFACALLFLRLRRLPLPVPGRPAALLLGASVVAMLANPSGLELVRYGAFHLQDVNEVLVLAEFMTPNWLHYKAFWLMAAAGVALALLELARRPHHALGPAWLLSFGLLAARAIRVVPKFMLVSVPFLASSLTRWEEALALRFGQPPQWRRAAKSLPLLVPLLTLLVSAQPMSYWFRPLALGEDPLFLPERMAKWVQEQGISGRCFASWDVSGFVEHRLPESPVFIDPRLRAYPPSLFQELEKADADPQAFEALMRRYDVEWAFRGISKLRLSGIGNFQPDHWALVYWDETGQVMLRRNVPRFAALIDRGEFLYFRPGADLLQSFEQLQGEARRRWVEELTRVAAYTPDLAQAQVGLCLEHGRLEEVATAIGHCEQALNVLQRRENVLPGSMPTTHRQLAIAYTQLGDVARRRERWEAARLAYEMALSLSPEWVGALAGLGFLELPHNPQRAKQYFQQALKRDPHRPQLQQGLAEAEARLEP